MRFKLSQLFVLFLVSIQFLNGITWWCEGNICGVLILNDELPHSSTTIWFLERKSREVWSFEVHSVKIVKKIGLKDLWFRVLFFSIFSHMKKWCGIIMLEQSTISKVNYDGSACMKKQNKINKIRQEIGIALFKTLLSL